METLQVDVSKLLYNIGEKIEYDYNDFFTVKEIGFRNRVNIKATISSVEQRIILHGELKTQISLQCSRCMENYMYDILEYIDEELVPLELVAREEEGKTLSLEELSIFPYSKETIELGEILRQYIILSRPVQPLCKKDCAGLCVQCGQNLNEVKCQCKIESLDPRWAALKNLPQIQN